MDAKQLEELFRKYKPDAVKKEAKGDKPKLPTTKLTKKGLEHKNFPIEVKRLTEEGEFEGHASVFDVLDYYNDIVVAGAFEETLEEHRKAGIPVAHLWQHRSDSPIGTWPKIAEDDIGLKVQGKLLLELILGKEAYVLLKANALGGMSIGYWPVTTEMDEETHVRKLKAVDLWEISLVTFPANPQARVSQVKDFSIRDLEQVLRDAGLSRKQATAVASHGFKGLIPREAKPDMTALNEIADLKRSFDEAITKANS